ncbi:MAG TPA: hypothetical protein VGO50_20855 [Pyrinomonadaceae bacterium]|jgi:hypothetical protein|nr:hypothetical protein [Pyrinomonadaceae bacterium]
MIKHQKILSMFFALFFGTMLLIVAGPAAAQARESEMEKAAISFFSSSDELRNSAKYGFSADFTGAFRPISHELRSELEISFPEKIFSIAKMKVLIDLPPKDYDLILIADKNGRIEGFMWASYWMIHPSKSFEMIFKDHRIRSNKDALLHAKVLAGLITSLNDDRIGNIEMKNGEIKVELIKGQGVFGILHIKMTKKMRFNRVIITDPDGRKLRYFV